MNRKFKSLGILLIGLLLVAITGALIGCSSGTTTSTTTTSTAASSTTTSAAVKHIKIGTIMGLTGPLAVPAGAFKRGWDIYADDLAAKGGIKIGNDRYVFDFIHEDSKGSAEGASVAASKLVNQDKVQFIIGAMLESEIAAIYQVTQPAGVLYGLANINIPEHETDVMPSHPLEVRLINDFDDNMAPDLDYVQKTYPNVKTIAISAPDIGYEGMIAKLQKNASDRGMSVVFTEKWAWGTTDFVPTFTRILASKPDLIFAMNSGQAPDQLVAARQLGFKGPFVSNSPIGADVIIAVAKDPGMLTDVLANSIDVFHPDAAAKHMIDAWKAKYGSDPFISDAVHAYDMPSIFAQAMEKGQTMDPAKVLATLETMTNKGDLQTNFGAASMGGMARHGVNRVLVRGFPLTRIMNGQTEFIGILNPVNQ